MPVPMSCKGIFSQELCSAAMFHTLSAASHKARTMEMKRSARLDNYGGSSCVLSRLGLKGGIF